MPKGFTKMNNFHNIQNYLEHYGKKGMKWGVRSNVTTAGFSKAGAFKSYKNKSGKRVSRNTVRLQKQIDAYKAVAGGAKDFKTKYKAARGISLLQITQAKGSLQKASATKINKGAEFQKKSNAGEAKVRTAMLKFGAQVRVSDLKFKA